MDPDKINIKGLDLKLDEGVQEICKVYNTSSGSSRSVLYFLLLINILSLIAVINSHSHNWSDDRIGSLWDTIETTYKHKQNFERLKNPDSFQYKKTLDSFNYKINLTKTVREFNIKNKIDRYQNVQIPVLGNSFDINNLGLVSGISFIVLLVILRFTLTREKNNLRIALQSISERYIYNYIEKPFLEEARRFGGDLDKVVIQINKTRRKHHYNFLSMNEVFNLPLLEVSDNNLQNTFFGRIVNRKLFYFPYFVYLVIFVNDLITIDKGLQTSFWHTILSTFLSFLCLWIISYLCKYCTVQKVIIYNLFAEFYSNNYHYNKSEEKLKKDTILQRILYPIEPVYKGVLNLVRKI